jgi:PAS domain-containing protein
LLFVGVNVGLMIYLALGAVPINALNDAAASVASHERKLANKNAQLDAALSNMVQGLCLFDRNRKIVVANARYAEIYGLKPEDIKPGTPHQAVIAARAQAGAYQHFDAAYTV